MHELEQGAGRAKINKFAQNAILGKITKSLCLTKYDIDLGSGQPQHAERGRLGDEAEGAHEVVAQPQLGLGHRHHEQEGEAAEAELGADPVGEGGEGQAQGVVRHVQVGDVKLA